MDGVKDRQAPSTPDVIEPAGAKSGKAHVIKSHHNVGGLPEYEARTDRAAARTVQGRGTQDRRGVGTAYEMVYRHPFPDRAVRILGGVRKSSPTYAARAEAIFIEELRRRHTFTTM